MKKALLLMLVSLSFVTLSYPLKAQSGVRPEHLLCEYLTNPEGIDEGSPGLSWTLAAVNPAAFGQTHTACPYCR